MQRLSRKLSLLLLALLASAVAGSLVPAPALGSTGNIHINKTTAPSAVVDAKLGSTTISLYFGDVIWSGGTINLYISTNGYSSLSSTDIAYGPTFSVAILQTSAKDTTTYKGYSIGYYWINGTVPTTLHVPGGHYYIKAFDGSTAAVAVTDNYINIVASLQVVAVSKAWGYNASYGPGQASILLNGYGLPAGGFANMTYVTSLAPTTVVKVFTLYQANSTGEFSYAMIAPDMKQAAANGTQTEKFDTITFTMNVASTVAPKTQTDTGTFIEGERGLKQVKGVETKTSASLPVVVPVGQVYGNGTNFATDSVSQVNVTVTGSLIIAGKWFHPGSLTFLWDTASATATGAVANATGWFNATITVPITSKGKHTVTINEGKDVFLLYVNVIPTLTLTPSQGVPCTSLTVTAQGYAFTASTSKKTYVVNATWYWTDWSQTTASKATTLLGKNIVVDTYGTFSFTFTLPHAAGGPDNLVEALENDTTAKPTIPFTLPTVLPVPSEGTWAYANFTVKPGVKVTPSSFANDGSIVAISGCGLRYGWYYDLLIDNAKDFYSGDSVGWTKYFQGDGKGDFSVNIVAAGFDPTLDNHVVALYELTTTGRLPTLVATPTGSANPYSYALFQVTSTTSAVAKLGSISTAIANLDKNLGSNSTSILAKLATIQSSISTLQTNVTTQISGLSSTLASILSYAQSASTAATSAATAATAAQTAATAAQTAATAASTAATGAQTAATGAQTAATGAQTAATAASTSAASAASSAASAATAATGAQTAAQAASATASTISTCVYAVIVLSLVAALASIFAVIILQRKVA
jgi:hypothetical protein